MASTDTPAFKDLSLPVEQRAADLVSRLTLREKISQMMHYSPGIPRLDIPEYNWWNEVLHGVARAGIATVFPQAIGLAAAWNDDLMVRIATVISDEVRAKHHEAARLGDRGIYKGLNAWSPNINILRDPRWGRAQETYGEDPWLTARLGVAFVRGLQGNDPMYLKMVATPKHFAAHSGPEAQRHSFNAQVSPRDMAETYLPAFEACVREAGAAAIMSAYTRTNGEPMSASHTLLQDVLRGQWGFKGYVVSDCGAIHDVHAGHLVTNTPEESAALAVKCGCELSCGKVYEHLLGAVAQGLITEAEIDRAVTLLFVSRFRLGMFDPPEMVPYTRIPYDVNDCDEHRQLALTAARQSIVLLKNDNDLLPLSKDLASIAVIGPNADVREVLLGNYSGMPSRSVTPLEGLRAKLGPKTRIRYAPGCAMMPEPGHMGDPKRGFSEAISAAQRSQAIILFLGLSIQLEEEECDRSDLGLPGIQQQLLETLCALGKPLVLVLLNGSPLAVNWAAEHAPAIVEAWYPGEEGGTAIADVLFGDYNPAGRLPATFHHSLDQLPPYGDYRMDSEKGRTYRYMKAQPLYSFGFGLSYTKFRYTNLRIEPAKIGAGAEIHLQVDVENVGKRAGDEVVQLYLSNEPLPLPTPIRHLEGFRRIHLAPGEKQTVTFTLTSRQIALVDEEGRRVAVPGRYTVTIGGSQPASDGTAQSPTTSVVAGSFVIGA